MEKYVTRSMSFPSDVLYRKQIGTNLRRCRAARGWSQQQLADRSTVSQDFIGRVERGQVNVSVDILSMLARALHVPLMDLLDPDRAK